MNHLLQALDMQEEIFSLGSTSRFIANQLSNLPAARTRRKVGHRYRNGSLITMVYHKFLFNFYWEQYTLRSEFFSVISYKLILFLNRRLQTSVPWCWWIVALTSPDPPSTQPTLSLTVSSLSFPTPPRTAMMCVWTWDPSQLVVIMVEVMGIERAVEMVLLGSFMAAWLNLVVLKHSSCSRHSYSQSRR